MSNKKTKILIVEDEEFLAKMLSRAWKEKKHEVVLASSGEEALRKVKEKPDFILLDVMLPDVDGVEILKQIKTDKETKDIPIIVSTNLGGEDTVSKIVQAGGTEYIVKSDWSIDDIVKKIEEKLTKK